MGSILTYILQINLLLAIVFLGYVWLLKGLTFYKLNRVYLLVGGGYSLLYPFLDIGSWFREEVIVHLPIALDYVDINMIQADTAGLRLIDVILLVVGMGAVILLSKFVVQLFSLLRIHLNSKMSTWGPYFFQNVLFPIVPFSFFNKIYVHEPQHADAELYDIFKHEYIHVKGLHTIDIILFEILLIGCWYNPFVWLMRKAVRQNLEFLTDQQVLDKGVDRQTYQYSLLNVNKQGTAVGIGNQFNFKTLKKRIMMMNKKRSSKIELSKYAFLLPILIFAGSTFTVNRAEGKIEELVDKVKIIPVDVVLPIGTAQQDLAEQDTLKGKVVGVSVDDDALQIEADQKGFPIGTDGKDPLFIHGRVGLGDVLTVLDGVPVKSEEIQKISPDEIESITVLKDKSATALYGDKGKNGVILIVTKSAKATKTLQGKVSGVRLGTADTTTSGNGRIVLRNATGKSGVKPLYVVDGKVMEGEYDLSAVDANTIHSVQVWKGEDARERYGEQGVDGVIVITTKAHQDKDSQAAGTNRTWTLSPNATKEQEMDFYARVGLGVKANESQTTQQKIYKDDIQEVTVVAYSSKGPNNVEATEAIDKGAEPLGGMTAFRKWVGDNLSYPKAAIDAGVKGTILVSFVVEKDGSLSNIRTIRDLGYGTGDNAVALIKRASKWKPGTKNGEPVRVEYTFPIRLDLSK